MQPGFEPQRCYRCGEVKPAIDFAWRRKHKLQRDTFCRPCRSAYGKEHYQKHRQRYIDQAQVVKQKLALGRTTWLIDFFKDHPCRDCGELDPIVLEFDHVTGQKAFDIGQCLNRYTWQAVLEEIDKCEVVCANCHRRRTARRRQSLRVRLTEGLT